MKNNSLVSKVLLALSLVGVILSAVVNLTGNTILNLAGTQWILIGIVLAVYAVYFSSCTCGTGGEQK